MHFVYILYSHTCDKFYIGETVCPKQRLIQHNSGFYDASSTAFTSDWNIVLTLKVTSRIEALKIERYVKSMKSKAFLRKLIAQDEFLQQFKKLVNQKFAVTIYQCAGSPEASHVRQVSIKNCLSRIAADEYSKSGF
ncbi:MAG: GIY-YIG nuclease family protein [Niabella sp.]|nr:GIY-YIG nuclease family protein [Niabella sp.]